MSGREWEADQLHLLLLVESAQRSRNSDSDIAHNLQDALEADAELEEAAA